METHHRRFVLEPLEDRRVLAAVIGVSIEHTQWTGNTAEAVKVDVAAPTSVSQPGAPLATGKTSLSFDEPTGDYRVSLLAAFDDPDGPDTDLVFSIIGNDGDPILDGLHVDRGTGDLILNFAAGVAGEAIIDVSATDADGNGTSTQFQLRAGGGGGQQTQPNLTSFTVTDDGDGNLIFSGEVSGPGALTAVFGDDLEGTTVPVSSNGTFSHIAPRTLLEESDPSGWVSVHVVNGLGESSGTLFVSWQE